MGRPVIYYGGTFAGSKVAELNERREKVIRTLWLMDYEVLDPLRGKVVDDPSKDIEHVYNEKLFTPNEIVHRDLKDVLKSDVLILEMTHPSIGASCEMMFANEHNKIIFVVSTNPAITEHPWIQSLSTRIFSTTDDAIAYLRFIL